MILVYFEEDYHRIIEDQYRFTIFILFTFFSKNSADLIMIHQLQLDDYSFDVI